MGVCAGLSMGQGSGKGFWDWTDPQQDGTLYSLPSYTAGVFLAYSIKGGIILEMDALYTESHAGQKIGDINYKYIQRSLELPLMLFKKTPLLNEKLELGLGPSLIYLPFKAEKQLGDDVKESYASQPFLLAISIGGNYEILLREHNKIKLQFRFVHPFISPVYHWESDSSGNNRFNHVDFRIAFNLKKRGIK